MIHKNVAAVVLLCALGCVSATDTEPVDKTEMSPWFRFEGTGLSPIVQLSLNGGPPRYFTIDTGAQSNFADPDLTELRNSNTVELDGQQFDSVPFATSVEFEHTSHGEAVWGVLGAPFFRDQILVMDYRENRAGLFISTDDALTAAEASERLHEMPVEVEGTPAGGWLIVPARIYGVDLSMMVDTGANNHVYRPLVEAALPPSLPRLEGLPQYNPQRGMTTATLTRVCELEIADSTVATTFLLEEHRPASPHDGIIGATFLSNRFVMFDYQRWRLLLYEYMEPEPTRGHQPFYFEKRSDGFYIWYVFPGTEVESLGIRADDRIVSVGGVELDLALSKKEVGDMLRGPLGTRRTMTIERLDAMLTMDFEIDHPLVDACPM